MGAPYEGMKEWETPLRILVFDYLSTKVGHEAHVKQGLEAVAEHRAQTGALQTSAAPDFWPQHHSALVTPLCFLFYSHTKCSYSENNLHGMEVGAR